MDKRNNKHKFVECFQPDISVLDIECRDFFSFDAGIGNENFNEFLKEEAEEYRLAGNGVTYIVWNIIDEKNKDIVAFFTVSANAIPYIDRIRIEEVEAEVYEEQFDEENWGIPVLEIKMFAVDYKYQDVFYVYEEQGLPIAVWCLYAIIQYATQLLHSVLGFKALFLHSVPDAEQFYLKNGFQNMKVNMQPFACVDSDMKPVWLPLKDIHMNYDE